MVFIILNQRLISNECLTEFGLDFSQTKQNIDAQGLRVNNIRQKLNHSRFLSIKKN